MTETKWIQLCDELPEGDEWVVLFNPNWHYDMDFPGLSISCSNPEFARENAIKRGYTHWCRVPYPLPISKSDQERAR